MLINLKHLSLKDFEIDDSVIEILNFFPKLSILQLLQCNISGDKTLSPEALKSLIMSYCEVGEYGNIVLPEIVNITAKYDTTIDLNSFAAKDTVKSLSIKNSDISNFRKINEFEGLEKLNIDGSKVDSPEVLEELKKRIEVSNEKEDLLIR
jgi:hypothetical protein